MLQLANAHPCAAAQQPGGKGGMLRPAFPHPYATAQQPGRKGRKGGKAERGKVF